MLAGVWLVRHGETDAPAGVAIGSSDPPLSRTGRAQAQALALELAPRPLTAVYSSDKIRAIATATPIAEAHGIAVQINRRVRELDFGAWEGRSLVSLWTEKAQAAATWERDLRATPPSFAENVAALELRVAAFWTRRVRARERRGGGGSAPRISGGAQGSDHRRLAGGRVRIPNVLGNRALGGAKRLTSRALPLVAAACIDLAVGEPPAGWHPVVLIGRGLAVGTGRHRSGGATRQLAGGAAALAAAAGIAALTGIALERGLKGRTLGMLGRAAALKPLFALRMLLFRGRRYGEVARNRRPGCRAQPPRLTRLATDRGPARRARGSRGHRVTGREPR